MPPVFFEISTYKLPPGSGRILPWIVQTPFFKFATNGASRLTASSLIFDKAGNLYGTTANGGANGAGTVFKLKPTVDGPWTETILYSFAKNKFGYAPSGAIVFDAAGNLYGTAALGGDRTCSKPLGCGTVFELSPQADGTWAPSAIHTFHGTNGSGPNGLVMDGKGNLFTPVQVLGQNNNCCGLILKLSPAADGVWNGTVLKIVLRQSVVSARIEGVRTSCAAESYCLRPMRPGERCS